MDPVEGLGTLTFLGGAGTVTGSKTMLRTPTGRLLVDCGLFQGLKELRRRNWEELPVPAAEFDAVLLTHAHLDHCGHLPRLVAQGFRGPVHCTPGTRRLAEIVLLDSAKLQEEQAAHANRHGYSKHRPALPLYTEEDARACLELLTDEEYGRPVVVSPGVSATWRRSGHILGAATIDVHVEDAAHPEGCHVVFSGDLGRDTHPLLLPPAPIDEADVVVTESTYGDESHPAMDTDEAIAEAIDSIVRRDGVLVIPAFAVDRTEVVLWHLDRLVREGVVPPVPVFLDSPMAARALTVYEEEALAGSAEIRPAYRGRPLFPSLDLLEVSSTEESKTLNTMRGPFVVVSASGMAAGGRVVHHLANRVGDRDNVVMLVGYQARGTRGAALAAGERSIRMLGRDFPVRARVMSVPLSSHADRDELVAWVGSAAPGPRRVVVNHGEPEATAALVELLEQRLDVPVEAARPGGVVTLGAG
jgi:metallo-beta-lactamase family protein